MFLLGPFVLGCVWFFLSALAAPPHFVSFLRDWGEKWGGDRDWVENFLHTLWMLGAPGGATGEEETSGLFNGRRSGIDQPGRVLGKSWGVAPLIFTSLTLFRSGIHQ